MIKGKFIAAGSTNEPALPVEATLGVGTVLELANSTPATPEPVFSKET